MVFLELTTRRDGESVLINVERICSIEQYEDFTHVRVDGNGYYVIESYDDIVQFLRDHLEAVI